MSAATIEQDETATGKVSRSARKRYQQSVFDNVCDPGILFDSRRIEAEWRKDRSVYEARVKACETLNVDLPKLETAAVEAAAAAREAEAFSCSAIPGTTTVAELRERIRAANPKLPIATPAEIANGLAFLADPSPSGNIGRAKSRVIVARGAVESARTAAQQTLYRTAPDAGPDSSTQYLQQEVEVIQRRISARQPTLQAEQLIKQQRAECEAIAAGEAPVPPMPGLTTDGKSEWLRRTYRAARAKLDQLCDLVAGKPAAEKQNAADQAELARLQAKIGEARASHLLRMAKPENMRWTD